MDVSDLRKRIIRALDDARRDASERRRTNDDAHAAFEVFLDRVARPLFRQALMVLRGEGHEFTLETPADAVRLIPSRSPEEMIEVALQVDAEGPQVLGRTRTLRGGRDPRLEERPLAAGKAIGDLTENDVTGYLVEEIPKLVSRH